MLAEKLNMDQEAAELWIVKLIRSAKLQVTRSLLLPTSSVAHRIR
jgi:hypothetical protein